MIKGKIIAGEYGKIIARQKAGLSMELGELVVADTQEQNEKVILQVYDLLYGSQISQLNLELISGMDLEEGVSPEFMEPALRNYHLALLKTLITCSKNKARVCKTLPSFFSSIQEITKEDLTFLTKPNHPLFLGYLRSGSKTLDVQIYLPGKEVLAHHILIPATTGRGKSNLTSVMLWDSVDKEYCGMLVLDPHDEYYGRTTLGLKDHPQKEKVVYYSTNPPPGQRSLKIHMKSITPSHFRGVLMLSDPQKQAMRAYYKKYGSEWIEAIIIDKPLDFNFDPATISVVKRQLMSLLDLEWGGRLHCNGIFDINSGQSTIADICRELEAGKVVIIDTSAFSGSVELLIGSLVSEEIFKTYKRYKIKGTLDQKPVISIVLEEAPRVLGREVLAGGTNIFESIAREGRKFGVGLMAITQLPSLIPREILANMNTKIILGIEMAPERAAIIESASQDLSMDHRNIASLDRGEAIITSNFARFATPVKIPLFSEFVKAYLTHRKVAKSTPAFDGVKLS